MLGTIGRCHQPRQVPDRWAAPAALASLQGRVTDACPQKAKIASRGQLETMTYEPDFTVKCKLCLLSLHGGCELRQLMLTVLQRVGCQLRTSRVWPATFPGRETAKSAQ